MIVPGGGEFVGFWSSIVLLSVAVTLVGAWWGRRPPRVAAVEPPSGATVAALVAKALADVGVRVRNVDADWVELVNDRTLPLRSLRERLARTPESERAEVVARQVDDWSVAGHVLTLRDFRHRVVMALSEAGLGAEGVADDEGAVRTSNGALALGRIHAECQALQPGGVTDRVTELVDQVRFANETPGSWEDVAPLVLPRVVRASTVDCQDERGWCFWVGPTLAAKVTWSRQGVHRFLDAHLARWGRDFESAMVAAVHNQAVYGVPLHQCREAKGAFLLKFADFRDANVFLLPDDAVEQFQIRGRMVVFAICMDCVFFAGEDDDEALALCVSEAQKTGPGRLHPAPLVRNRELDWAPFRPAEDHPLRAAIDELHARQLVEEVVATADVVARRFPNATVTTAAAAVQDGRWSTHAVWPASEVALPGVDSVIVVDARGRELRASFSDVRRIAGDILQVVPGLRTRWWHATGAFPAEKLEELRAAATAPAPGAGVS